MTNTVLLLGAGASAEAGIPMTADLTHGVISSIREKAVQAKQASEARRELERYELSKRAESGDQHARRQLDDFIRTHPNEPLPPLERESALDYTYGRLRAVAAADPSSPVAPPVDLETVIATLELLADRRQQGLSAFVRDWEPGLLRLDHGRSGLLSSVELNSFDRRLWNFVEVIVEQRLTEGNGRAFESARRSITAELPHHLAVDPESTDYLKPIGEWAKAQSIVTVATLNFDRAIEVMAKRAGVSLSTGIGEWRNGAEIVWPQWATIRLIKLHGSVDWDRQRVFKNDKGFLLGGPNKLTADGPYLDLLQEFRRALIGADRVVIIGYSRRDAHINSVIRRAAIVRARAVKRTTIELVDPHFDGATIPPELDSSPEHDKGMIDFKSHRMSTGEALRDGLLTS